jgi:hypothetical protein
VLCAQQTALDWLDAVDVCPHALEHHNVPRFLNRLLGIPSEWQRRIFDLFSAILDKLIVQAKREMSYDQGIRLPIVGHSVVYVIHCGDRVKSNRYSSYDGHSGATLFRNRRHTWRPSFSGGGLSEAGVGRHDDLSH